MSITQNVAASIEISRAQATKITSTDLTDAGEGSYITVITGVVMITLFDLAAAMTYREAWTHPVDIVGLLPNIAAAAPRPANKPYGHRDRTHQLPTIKPGPSILIQAHGTDRIKFGYDRRENSLLVRIGAVTWTVRDHQAYTSMTNAFTRAHTLAEIIMPPIRRR